MFARLVLLFYAIVSYAVFLVSSLYEAIVVDLLLLGMFAYQQYRRRVPMLLPRICGRSRAGAPQ